MIKPLEDAAHEGNSSLFVNGIDPGFANDLVPLALMGTCQSIEQVRCMEIVNYATYDSATVMFDVMGFGKPMDEIPMLLQPGVLSIGWGSVVRQIAAGLDVELDELRTRDGLSSGTVMLQVSGSAEPAARERITAMGAHYGTFHPLLPLLDPALASMRLQGSVIGVEGDETAHGAAVQLAARLGATTIDIPRGERAAYHAAAVIASNFPVTLAALAEGLLSRIGADSVAAHRAVRVLMAASVENLAAAPRALDALTGPIARHDATTVRAHTTALHGTRPYHEVYEIVSRATLALMRERGDDPEAVQAMETALDADGLR
jgi:predicted short-subunit dehydrogenase-like oxidoreductase (DUF2520 family)